MSWISYRCEDKSNISNITVAESLFSQYWWQEGAGINMQLCTVTGQMTWRGVVREQRRIRGGMFWSLHHKLTSANDYVRCLNQCSFSCCSCRSAAVVQGIEGETFRDESLQELREPYGGLGHWRKPVFWLGVAWKSWWRLSCIFFWHGDKSALWIGGLWSGDNQLWRVFSCYILLHIDRQCRNRHIYPDFITVSCALLSCALLFLLFLPATLSQQNPGRIHSLAPKSEASPREDWL